MMKIEHPCSMALKLSSIPPIHQKPISILSPKYNTFCNFLCFSSSSTTITTVLAATAEGKGGDSTDEGTFTFSAGSRTQSNINENSTRSSSARTQLDLLDQLTSSGSSVTGYESDGRSSRRRLTIRDQLAMLVGDREYKDEDEFSIPLGKNLKKFTPKFLTVSQKRNIKRQSYLNEVSKRNDSVFFATIGAFVILPPLIILGVCIATGYVQLFP